MSHGSISKSEITDLVDSEANVDVPLADVLHVPPSFDYCCPKEMRVLRDDFGAGPSSFVRSIEKLFKGLQGASIVACHRSDRPARDRFAQNLASRRMIPTWPVWDGQMPSTRRPCLSPK